MIQLWCCLTSIIQSPTLVRWRPHLTGVWSTLTLGHRTHLDKIPFSQMFWRAFQRKNVQGRRCHQPAASRWLFQDVPQLSTFLAYTLLGQTQNFGTKKIALWLIRMGCRLSDSMMDPLLGTVHLQIFYDFCGLACILVISSPNKQTSITSTKHVALSGGDFVCLYVKP